MLHGLLLLALGQPGPGIELEKDDVAVHHRVGLALLAVFTTSLAECELHNRTAIQH